MKVIFFLISLIIPQLSLSYYIQLPDQCVAKKTFPCAVMAYRKTFFSVSHGKIYLSKDSLIEMASPDDIYLSKGLFWLETKKNKSVSGRFGSIHVVGEGQVWIDASEDHWMVKAIGGQVTLNPRGVSETFSLAAGYEMRIGSVDYQSKTAQYSLPMVINLQQHLKNVAQLFPFSNLNFKEYIDHLGSVIASAAVSNSEWHKTIVERKIAQHNEQSIRLKYETEKNSVRDAYLRKLFRQKSNFED